MIRRTGRPLGDSPDEFREAAEIRSEDIQFALLWMQEFGGPGYRALAEATPFERDHLTAALIGTMVTRGYRYAWLVQQAQYYDLAQRRVVPPAQIRRTLDRALLRAGNEARVQTLGMRNLADWELMMRRQIKDATLGATLSANGGVERTHLGALEAMQARVEEQFTYLARYARQIESGEQPVDGRAATRSAAYVLGARGAHMQARTEAALAAGLDEGRSLLNPADHCDVCVEQAALGWQPVADIIPIGERTCLWNCKCDIEFRSSHAASRGAA